MDVVDWPRREHATQRQGFQLIMNFLVMPLFFSDGQESYFRVGTNGVPTLRFYYSSLSDRDHRGIRRIITARAP